MVPNDKDVLIGSKCLSCNRPLGGFGQPQVPKGLDEWYTGAGGLSGSRERVVEAAGGNRGSGSADGGNNGGHDGGGGGSSSAGIVSSRSPGRTQPVITPAKVLPLGSASSSSEGSGTAGRKGPQGPLLFERTGGAEGARGSGGAGLQGRMLRGGGGGVNPTSEEGNVSVSKVSSYVRRC